jgi:hypothetical protein
MAHVKAPQNTQTRPDIADMIEFVGFADDCRVEGRVDLQDSRLADLLNKQPSITVRDCILVSTLDGHSQSFDELEIGRDELDAVVASGPRGDPRRRLATRPAGVSVKLGPYSAEGFMHGPPAANPFRGLDKKPAMVALTDAVLEYEFCREAVEERFGTLLVNRRLAQSMRLLAGYLTAAGMLPESTPAPTSAPAPRWRP